jgi:hypothetical protein
MIMLNSAIADKQESTIAEKIIFPRRKDYDPQNKEYSLCHRTDG